MPGRRPPLSEALQDRLTKIFITNLPDKCSGFDLAEFIRPIGKIFDLYIARKRDKYGNRFGFVSLLDVKDKKDMVALLSNIRMGDFRLKANVARFSLEDGEIGQDPKMFERKFSNMRKDDRQEGSHRAGKTPIFNAGGRSFKDILTGNRGGTMAVRSVVVNDQINMFKDLQGRALIARMMDLDALKNIIIILHDICPGIGKVQYLGGLSVMISFVDKEITRSVLAAAKETIGRFSSVIMWEGQSLPYERLAWPKVQGIPLHLISNEVLELVGGVIGKVVHRPRRSEEDGDLSYDYIGVMIADGFGLKNIFLTSR